MIVQTIMYNKNKNRISFNRKGAYIVYMSIYAKASSLKLNQAELETKVGTAMLGT